MKNINIEAVAQACHGTYYGEEGLKNQEVSSIWTDSRKVEQDSLFIPIVGERLDGHDFIEQVFEKGALFTLSERPLDLDVPYVLVESSLQALKDIAAFYLEQLDIPVVGVTGSVGKTSTKEIIASVLSQKYNTLKTDGNFNNEIGLPLTVFRLREEHEAAVLEMGISDFGEMSRLTAVAKPDIAVITNIGLCHLENLRSRDGILEAKTEIFEGLKEKGAIILNGDDDKLATIQEYRGITPIFFGQGEGCSIRSEQVENLGLKGSECTICTPQGKIDVTIPVPGLHMVQNALAACAVGLQMGLGLGEIQRGIAALEPVKGRMNLIYGKKYTIIDDCYNANPVSMKSSVDILCNALGRKVCILGDMFELGKNERELHADVGRYVADADIELLITVGTLSRHINEEAKANQHCICVHFDEREKVFAELPKLLQEGDSVLVKASHGMEFPEIVDYIQSLQS